HIGDYYSANEAQVAWLREQGFTAEEIGEHAGIRDTAEMLYLMPEGVRKDPLQVADKSTGHNGDPRKASKKIGAKMTELKIEAALKQINAILAEKDAEHADRNKDDFRKALPLRIYR